MNGREIIKDIMKKKEITNATLADTLKITQAALWDRIDTTPRGEKKPRKDIPVSLLSEMVRVMGYKVMVVPRNTRLPENGYLIGESETINTSEQDNLVESKPTTPPEPKKTGKRIKLK